MSSLIPAGGGAGCGDVGGGGAGGGDVGGGGAGGGDTSLEAVASPAPPPMASGSVDNWLGSTSFSTQAGSQQPEAPLPSHRQWVAGMQVSSARPLVSSFNLAN